MKKLFSHMAIGALIGMTALAQPVVGQTLTRAADPEVYDPNGLFKGLDKDNDDQFSLDEYVAYVDRYADLGDVTSINIRNNDGYEGVFRHYDKDNNQRLSREELGASSRINIDSALAT